MYVCVRESVYSEFIYTSGSLNEMSVPGAVLFSNSL